MELKVLLIILYILVCSHEQTIDLFEYRQQDSDTQCTEGLLSDVDTVVFKSRVDYSQDQTMKHIIFLMKRKTDKIFMFVKDFNIQEDCKDENNVFCKRINEYTVNLYVHIKASKDISGARLRGKLITSFQKDIFSDDQIIPEIYDLKDERPILIINGYTVDANSDDCQYNVSSSDISIVFSCQTKVNPNYVELSSEDPRFVVFGTDHVAHQLKANVGNVVNIKIKYGGCGQFLTKKCNIKTEKKSSSSFNPDDYLHNLPLDVITVLVPASIIIGAFTFSVYNCFRRRRGGIYPMRKTKNNMNELGHTEI